MARLHPATQQDSTLRFRLAPLVICAWACASHAQTTPVHPPYGIGDAMKEAQPPRPAPPARAPVPNIIQEEGRMLALPSGETLTVREFTFEGGQPIPEADLQAELAPYVGRALTLAEIQQAAARITGLYRTRGYLLARAYVPRQDASGGILLLRVVPGAFGKLTLKNHSLVRDPSILSMFAPLQAETAVTLANLERAMLNVGDLPGAQLPKLTISPGEAAGSSDFDIDVGEGKRLGGFVLADNQGSRFTGENRLSAGVDVNSPFGLGDKFSVNAMGTNGGGLLNGRAAYSAPLGGSGLRAGLAASKTTYELGGDYADLDATGEAHTVEATLSYPLRRSRDQNLTLSMNLAEKHLRDDVKATAVVDAKKADVATLALQRDAWSSMLGHASFTSATVGLTYGHLKIADPAQAALNQAGANTAGRYARLNLSLLADIDLSKGWSVNATASAQKALGNKNLDPSEQMSISGSNGVKTYREWISGDNAYLLGATLNYALPTWGRATQAIGAFAELGRAHLQDASYATSNGVRLSDIGLSYKASVKGWIAGLQLAHTVGPRPAEFTNRGSTRLLAQLGMQY